MNNEFQKMPDEESMWALWPYAVAGVGLALIAISALALAEVIPMPF